MEQTFSNLPQFKSISEVATEAVDYINKRRNHTIIPLTFYQGR